MKMERKARRMHGVGKLCLMLGASLGFGLGSPAVMGQNGKTAQAAVASADDAQAVSNKAVEPSQSAGVTANALGGMIDGDAPEIVPESVLPKVLSEAEREKLGMTQGRFELPTLAAASTALPDGNADGERYPETFVQQFGEFTEPLPESGAERGADWHWSWCYWSAANTFSNPRYFEDRMLERHGQECLGCWQPFASGARFFGTVPMLPYLWTVSNPCDCDYSLGYYPAGQCVPVMMQRPPYENRAAVVEVGTAAALIIGFP